MYCERLRGVVIEHRPAIDVLRSFDWEDSLHYVDPPYVHDTRNLRRGNAYYAHELSDEEHAELLGVLKELSGFVVLSGYQTELYDDILLPDGWQLVKKESTADGRAARVECLYLNPRCASAQAQLSMFGYSEYLVTKKTD